ncbi:MAG: SRPBCC family protein [Cyanobacteriota bacterium]|nr:SRPBCC family protein [Cyanobacteriota bacterium]
MPEPQDPLPDLSPDGELLIQLGDPALADPADHEESERLEADLEEDLTGDVDVAVTDLGGRQRQITASLPIASPPESIWQVLTDYECLAEFIPNLVESAVVGEEDGCKLVRQVGQQKVMFAKFSATVVLKLEEKYPSQIAFSQHKGDFKIFAGSWDLIPSKTLATPLTKLSYTLKVLPPRHLPVNWVERRLRRDLSVNLLAIRERVENIVKQP